MTEIISKLVMDIQDWVEPIQDAKAHLADISGVTTKSVASIRNAFSSLSNAKSALAGKFQQIDNGDAPYKVLLGSIRDLNRSWGSETGAASQQAVSATAAVAKSNFDVSKSTTDAKSSVMSLAESIGTKAAIAWVVYKIAGEDAIAASQKHIATNSDLRKSVGSLYSSVTGLASEITGTLVNGVKASLNAMLQWQYGISSVEDAIDRGAKAITSWANFGSKAINQLKSDFREAALVAATSFVIFQQGQAAGDTFHEQGVQLQKMAEETTKVIAKQEQMKSVLDFVKDSAKRAGESQAHAAEIAKIGTIDNLTALEAAEQAFKVSIRDTKEQVSATKEWKAVVDQMQASFAKQRVAIETGTVKKTENPVDKQITEAQQALKRVALSETDFAVATAVANGATAAQVNALRAAMDAKRNLTAANEAQAASERATAEAAQQAAQRFDTGKEKIAALRDQIDLLNGTATEADLAMRELFRQGFDMDQIGEIGELTAEIEKLKDGSKKRGGGREGENSAALEGSSQAAELILKGSATSNPNKKMEQLLQQSVTIQTQIASRDPIELDVEEVNV